MTNLVGRYSMESLYHFSCGACRKWWSVGDAIKVESTLHHCPHCGAQQHMMLARDLDASKDPPR